MHKNEIGKFAESLSIGYAKRRGRWWDFVDEFIRLSAACFTLMSASVLVSIPIILINPLDHVLVRLGVLSSQNKLSTYAKRFITSVILLVSGIELVVEGLCPETLDAFYRSHTLGLFSDMGTILINT